ncbi:MAG: oxaloacetate decarboxylase subunit gamma [Pseudomonadota bacterium]
MSELFATAAEIMLVGMGVVLAFLLLLILVMTLMARFIPTPKPVSPSSGSAQQNPSNSEDAAPAEVIAAISAAVHRYRRTRQ